MDSLGASSGYGLLMDRLCDLWDEGKSIDEVYAFALENRLRLHHWFFSTDLTFYVKRRPGLQGLRLPGYHAAYLPAAEYGRGGAPDSPGEDSHQEKGDRPTLWSK